VRALGRTRYEAACARLGMRRGTSKLANQAPVVCLFAEADLSMHCQRLLWLMPMLAVWPAMRKAS
jgi:hypothetical protein